MKLCGYNCLFHKPFLLPKFRCRNTRPPPPLFSQGIRPRIKHIPITGHAFPYIYFPSFFLSFPYWDKLNHPSPFALNTLLYNQYYVKQAHNPPLNIRQSTIPNMGHKPAKCPIMYSFFMGLSQYGNAQFGTVTSQLSPSSIPLFSIASRILSLLLQLLCLYVYPYLYRFYFFISLYLSITFGNKVLARCPEIRVNTFFSII